MGSKSNMNNNKNIRNICHLLGFDLLSKDEIKIDSRFCLRRVSSEEINQFRQMYKNNVKDFYDWESYQNCIENNEDKDLGELYLEFNDIVFAMWLFSGYSIFPGAMISLPGKPLRTRSTLGFFRCENGWGIWKANKDEIKRFSVFWNYITQNQIQFSGIWKRFVYKGLKEAREQCIVNFTIAMDNILLPNEDRNLKSKFSFRAGALLGDNYNKREKIVTFFRKAYKQRSNIVHGNNWEYSDQELLLYIHFCRKIILIYLDNQSNWKEAIREIELWKNRLIYRLADSMINLSEIIKGLKGKVNNGKTKKRKES